jgi:hypothetical protein
MIQRVFELLAPEETAAERALPLTLLVRPGPMLGLGLLALNDHVLKGSGLLPGWLTGKLSDFAGLLFFPLLLVTLVNLLEWALNSLARRPLLRASPTTFEVVLACVLTAAFFSAVQIHPDVAWAYGRATAILSLWSDATMAEVTMDPTDVVAVPMVILSFWLGQRGIAQLPPGRLPWLRARLGDTDDPEERESLVRTGLGDVRAAVDEERRPFLDELGRALLEDAPDEELDALLKRLRGNA